MDLTITIGWWIAPLSLTVGVIVGLSIWEAMQPSATGYGAIGGAAVSLIVWMFWALVILIAWLVYFIAI